jgi:hypothetical protein
LELAARKARFAELLSGTECAHVRYSESFDGAEALLKACASMGLEGIVSKRRDAPYRSGPCHSWIKIKTRVWREAMLEALNANPKWSSRALPTLGLPGPQGSPQELPMVNFDALGRELPFRPFGGRSPAGGSAEVKSVGALDFRG